MLTNDKIDDLTRMFQLFRRVDPDHRILISGFTAHIQAIGKEINSGFVRSKDKAKEPEPSAAGQLRRADPDGGDQGHQPGPQHRSHSGVSAPCRPARSSRKMATSPLGCGRALRAAPPRPAKSGARRTQLRQRSDQSLCRSSGLSR